MIIALLASFASASCSDDDLRKTVETAGSTTLEGRRRVVASGLALCQLPPDLAKWVNRWAGTLPAGTTPSEEIFRKPCKKVATSLADPISPGWVEQVRAIHAGCKIKVLSQVESVETYGPYSMIVGELVYRALLEGGRDKIVARSVGRVVAGLPEGPGEHVGGDVYGVYASHSHGLLVPRNHEPMPPYRACAMIIAVGPQEVRVDGKPGDLDALVRSTRDTLRQDCSPRTLFVIDAMVGWSKLREVFDVVAGAGLTEVSVLLLRGEGGPRDTLGEMTSVGALPLYIGGAYGPTQAVDVEVTVHSRAFEVALPDGTARRAGDLPALQAALASESGTIGIRVAPKVPWIGIAAILDKAVPDSRYFVFLDAKTPTPWRNE